MAKAKSLYSCTDCGTEAPKWAGQCGDCGAWNTLIEITSTPTASSRTTRYAGFAGEAKGLKVQRLDSVSADDVNRFKTGSEEFDRVLGGGLVPGSVVLLGGDPGIGKSTLLLQILTQLDKQAPLYITGEESLQQVSARAVRLGLQTDTLGLLVETRVEDILNTAQKEKPRVMVVDSIQTIYTDEIQSAPGGVAQVRESAALLVRYAKQTQTTIFLVGHVTKEGNMAGPRVLEHMVDTVLYFEGDSGSRYRLIRAIKNRYGAVNELGVFAMTEKGLRDVSNPSAIFLSQHEKAVSGSVVTVTLEGNRPLLV